MRGIGRTGRKIAGDFWLLTRAKGSDRAKPEENNAKIFMRSCITRHKTASEPFAQGRRRITPLNVSENIGQSRSRIDAEPLHSCPTGRDRRSGHAASQQRSGGMQSFD